MGQNVAENRSDQIINTTMEIINNDTSACRGQITQDQLLNIEASGPGTVVNVGDIRWRQAVVLNTSCYQQSLNSTTLENDIRQRAEQQATAINQALSITGNEARSINESTINLAQKVVNATRQECGDVSRQAQAARVSAVEGAVVNVATLDWDQTFNGILNCVQNTQSVTLAKNQLDQQIVQNTKGETQDTFGRIALIGGIALVIIIIIIAIIVIVAGPTIAKSVTGAAAASLGAPGGVGVALGGLTGL